jgi:hypothetical protein
MLTFLKDGKFIDSKTDTLTVEILTFNAVSTERIVVLPRDLSRSIGQPFALLYLGTKRAFFTILTKKMALFLVLNIAAPERHAFSRHT